MSSTHPKPDSVQAPRARLRPLRAAQPSAASGESQGDRLLELLITLRSVPSPDGGDPRDGAAQELRALLLARVLRCGVPPQDAEDVVHETLLQALLIPIAQWVHAAAILPTLARRRSVDRIRSIARERQRLAPESFAPLRESA